MKPGNRASLFYLGWRLVSAEVESPNRQPRWFWAVSLIWSPSGFGALHCKGKNSFGAVPLPGFPLVCYIPVSSITPVLQQCYKSQHIHALITLSKWFISSNLLESTRLYPWTSLFWSLPVLTLLSTSSSHIPAQGMVLPELTLGMDLALQRYFAAPANVPHTAPAIPYIPTPGSLSLSHNKLFWQGVSSARVIKIYSQGWGNAKNTWHSRLHPRAQVRGLRFTSLALREGSWRGAAFWVFSQWFLLFNDLLNPWLKGVIYGSKIQPGGSRPSCFGSLCFITRFIPHSFAWQHKGWVPRMVCR